MRSPFDYRPRSDAATALDWMSDAACAEIGSELFFPERGGTAVPAKKICGSCDVRVQCLAYALRTGQEEGVWGGKSARQLGKISKAGWAA